MNALIAQGRIISTSPARSKGGFHTVLQTETGLAIHLYTDEHQANKLDYGREITVMGEIAVDNTNGMVRIEDPHIVWSTAGAGVIHGNVGARLASDRALVVVDRPGDANNWNGTWWEVKYPDIAKKVKRGQRITVLYHPAYVGNGKQDIVVEATAIV